MKRISICFFIVGLFSNGCYWGDSKASLDRSMASEMKRESEKHRACIKTQNNLVEKIAKHNRVEGEHYGFTGAYSEAYKWMDSLQKIAVDSELVHFTKNQNAVVRVYAFWGLTLHHYDSIGKIIDEHLCDTASFEYQAGCITSRQSVNHFCLSLLDSSLHIDDKGVKFSDEERMKYEKKMLVTCGIH